MLRSFGALVLCYYEALAFCRFGVLAPLRFGALERRSLCAMDDETGEKLQNTV